MVGLIGQIVYNLSQNLGINREKRKGKEIKENIALKIKKTRLVKNQYQGLLIVVG